MGNLTDCMYYLMMLDLKPYDCDEAFYRVIGSPPATTVVGAGFMQKRMRHGVDWPGGVFNQFSASLVLRGTGMYVQEDGTTSPLEPGSLFFRIPGVPHSNSFDPDSGWLEFFVAFRLDASDAEETGGDSQESLAVLATQLLMLDPQSPVHKVRLDSRILRLCRTYVDRMKRGERIDTSAMDGLWLLVELLKNNPPEVQIDPLIDDVCALLRDNIEARTPLPELFSNFPLSYGRLRERFVSRMGMSMGRYQLRCRMEQAARLLLQGESVKAVASQLGYSDPFAFSKQFKQVVGMTPTSYRESPRPLPPQPDL